MENEKSKLLSSKKIIWVVCIAIVVTAILVLWSIAKQPKFEIGNFSLKSETTNYTSITNSTTYEGTAEIISSNKKETYLVAVKVKRKAGGNEEAKKEYITMTMVSDGKGELSTYDSGEVGKIEKPEYEFEIVGSVKF